MVLLGQSRGGYRLYRDRSPDRFTDEGGPMKTGPMMARALAEKTGCFRLAGVLLLALAVIVAFAAPVIGALILARMPIQDWSICYHRLASPSLAPSARHRRDSVAICCCGCWKAGRVSLAGGAYGGTGGGGSGNHDRSYRGLSTAAGSMPLLMRLTDGMISLPLAAAC
jgi:hypothetical protein